MNLLFHNHRQQHQERERQRQQQEEGISCEPETAQPAVVVGNGEQEMPLPSSSIEPDEHSVLLGRGGKNNQHSGNDVLRQFAKALAKQYRQSTKKGKSIISRQLVGCVRECIPMGFVRYATADLSFLTYSMSLTRNIPGK